jgi:hypothetical protein
MLRNSVDGIVTRADLQKPPVRLILFGLITLFEMHLTYLVRHFYPDEGYLSKLSKPRIRAAQELMSERKERNEDLDFIDCLQFGDKTNLVLSKDEIAQLLGIEPRKQERCLNRFKN